LIPTAIDGESPPLHASIAVEQLFAHHDEGHGEDERSQAHTKDGSDERDGKVGAIPLRENFGIGTGV
jgi:hypothetical protein